MKLICHNVRCVLSVLLKDGIVPGLGEHTRVMDPVFLFSSDLGGYRTSISRFYLLSILS